MAAEIMERGHMAEAGKGHGGDARRQAATRGRCARWIRRRARAGGVARWRADCGECGQARRQGARWQANDCLAAHANKLKKIQKFR
ncbi:hypothetical protein EJB05_32746, partial [Eragrostis curvula]